LIGWFEVRSGVGLSQKIDLLQVKEIIRDKKQVIQIEHLLNLKSRKKCEGGAIGDEIEVIEKNIKLLDCSKSTFWLDEKQKVVKVRLFSSREAYQKALKRSFPFIDWHFDQ